MVTNDFRDHNYSDMNFTLLKQFKDKLSFIKDPHVWIGNVNHLDMLGSYLTHERFFNNKKKGRRLSSYHMIYKDIRFETIRNYWGYSFDYGINDIIGKLSTNMLIDHNDNSVDAKINVMNYYSKFNFNFIEFFNEFPVNIDL